MEKTFREKVADFCKPRAHIGDTEGLIYLEEIDYLCPICGKHLYRRGELKLNKDYQIAHIFPNRPAESDFRQLDGVELFGECSESYENKIATCKDCHWDFDQNKTKAKYYDLLNKKKSKMANRIVKIEASHLVIEQELLDTIQKVAQFTPEDFKDLSLSYDALQVSQKIDDKDLLLRNEIEFNVRMYFTPIDDFLRNMCRTTNSDIELAASSVRQTYLKCKKYGMDKSKTFEALSQWLISKTSCDSNIARIIISYFVQHCEVYDKLS